MDDISTTFLNQVKRKMKRIGKTQIQLADDIGVDYSIVNKTFNDNRILEFSLAIKIAKDLNLSIDKISRDYPICESFSDLIDDMDDIIHKLKVIQKSNQ